MQDEGEEGSTLLLEQGMPYTNLDEEGHKGHLHALNHHEII